MRRRSRFLLLAAAASALLWLIVSAVFSPFPRTGERFDRGRNGIWLGHQWLTGTIVRSGEPVPDSERAELIERLRRHHITWAYVHAGPIQPDGSLPDRPGSYFEALRRDAPADVRFLPWIGGLTSRFPLPSAEWRRGFLDHLAGLVDAGRFEGVHLDIEPIQDGEPGYLELLADIRARFGPGFLISHATRRAGPFGSVTGPLARHFWSEGFYRRTMAIADQTVLMAYDTMLSSQRMYVGFVRHETSLLLDWACARPGHQVVIGLASYEDMPHISDPTVENLRTGALGVRAALERHPDPRCFEGVAIYADWVTDPEEWRAYRETWLATK